MQNDVLNSNIQGLWQYNIYKRSDNGIYLDYCSDTVKNVIVINSAFLIPHLIVSGSHTLWHEFGEGLVAWDTSLPVPDVYDSSLLTPLHRQQPDLQQKVKIGFGTAQSGSLNTIVDLRRVSGSQLIGRIEPSGYFVGETINIVAGTNNGLSRQIAAYDQATGTITVDSTYPTAITSTSQYEIVSSITTSDTNAIKIKTVIPFGDGTSVYNNKDIREQSLFGGSSTSSVGSGLMINRLIHPKIHKDATIQLEMFVTLIFKV